MIKYFFLKHKPVIIISLILIVCSVAIAIGIYAQVTNAKIIDTSPNVEPSDYDDLKNSFNDIFTNTIYLQDTAKISYNIQNPDDIIYRAYYISQEKSGSYSLSGDIPMFKIETDTTKKINDEIFDLFVKKYVSIMEKSSIKIICNVDYVGYVNGNIASLVIRCSIKEGSNPQRTKIKTYNYDIKNDKLLSFNDILNLKNLDSSNVQKDIYKEIKTNIEKSSSFNSEGYNIYNRNISDDMYKIENTSTFFLGRNNYLYIVYAYGNNDFTSEMDLIIY